MIAGTATSGQRRRDRPATAGEYSPQLARLGAFAVHHKALIFAVWIGTAVVLALLFPQLETVVRQQSVDLVPRDAPSLQTVDRMSAAFSEQGSRTMLVVAMEDPAGLTPAARQHYERLVARLRADTTHVLFVQDLLADPVTKTGAISADRKAWYLPVGVAGTLGDPAAAESVTAVRAIAAEVFAGSPTTVEVTGPAATFADQIASMEHSLLSEPCCCRRRRLPRCAPSVVPWLRHRQSARASPASASAWRRGGGQTYLRRPTSRRTGDRTWRRSHHCARRHGGHAALRRR